MMSTLGQANPYFVRCIKPNAKKVADEFSPQMVMNQLKYSGMMETVRIRRSGQERRERGGERAVSAVCFAQAILYEGHSLTSCSATVSLVVPWVCPAWARWRRVLPYSGMSTSARTGRWEKPRYSHMMCNMTLIRCHVTITCLHLLLSTMIIFARKVLEICMFFFLYPSWPVIRYVLLL